MHNRADETGQHFGARQIRRPKRVLMVAVPAGAALLVVCAGCQPPPQRIEDIPPGARPPAGLEREILGRSHERRPIECWRLGDGGEGVLIIASIHGDEPAGTPLVRRLAEYLLDHPDLLARRRVWVVPVANPDGYARRRRHNARGVDLNRNYPAANYEDGRTHGAGALSEPESAALHELIRRHRPGRIVSIHQPLRSGTACIDYDGPAESLARAMAEHCDLPVRRIGSRPGSLGSYAGATLGIPIITLELPASASGWSAATLWRRYGRMMLAAIRYPEALGPVLTE